MPFMPRPGIGAAVLFALFLLSGVQAQVASPADKAPSADSSIVDQIGDGKIDWSNGEVRAIGIGYAPAFATTRAQMTALAREAAIVAAERNLLKAINGVQVDSEITVENQFVTHDIIKTRVSGLLTGAVILSESVMRDGGYQVVLAVNLVGRTSSVAQSIDLANSFQQANPQTTVVPTTAAPVPNPAPEQAPQSTPAPPPASPEAYTGLVIDCRGLGMVHSLCPRILDQSGQNIWSTLSVSAELVNERGIAGFFESLNDPRLVDRAGKHPLVIRALRVSGGKTFKTDAVVSPADAELIRNVNAEALFLEKLNVAFLVDK